MTDKQPEPATAAAMPARGRNWTRTLLWIAGPALVLGIGGWLYVTSGRYAATDNAYVQADHVTIAPQIAGRVVEVNVRENQAVAKGDVLFRIDPEPLEIAFARMQAQVESVGSMLGAARSGYASAQADLRSAQADLVYKQQQFQRMKELREPRKLPAWLCAIARNMARNAIRRSQRDPLAHAGILFKEARVDHIHAAGIGNVVVDQHHFAVLTQIHPAQEHTHQIDL